MALLFATGAETGHPVSEGAIVDGAGVTADTGISNGVHARSASWKFLRNNAQGNLRTLASFVGVSGRRYWVRTAVRRTGLPNQAATILQFGSGTTVGTRLAWHVRLKIDGTIALYDAANAEVAPITSNSALSDTVFTLIEFGLTITAAGGTDSCELWVNEVKTHQASGSVTDTLPNFLHFGWVIAPNNVSVADRTLYMDDVIVNDDQGASFNTRMGKGHLALLRPVADSARVGWTDGNGGTSNLFGALDNVPPIGEATTGTTAASQIEDAQNNNTDNYTASVESYDEASIPATTTIRAVQALACVSVSSLTGTNDGNLRTLTNPVDAVADATANISFEISGAIAAAFPTGWQGVVGSPVYSPTVVRATRPTWRIGKRTASTRVMAACGGGLWVEYQDITDRPIGAATTTAVAGGMQPTPGAITVAMGGAISTAVAGGFVATGGTLVGAAVTTASAGGFIVTPGAISVAVGPATTTASAGGMQFLPTYLVGPASSTVSAGGIVVTPNPVTRLVGPAITGTVAGGVIATGGTLMVPLGAAVISTSAGPVTITASIAIALGGTVIVTSAGGMRAATIFTAPMGGATILFSAGGFAPARRILPYPGRHSIHPVGSKNVGDPGHTSPFIAGRRNW